MPVGASGGGPAEAPSGSATRVAVVVSGVAADRSAWVDAWSDNVIGLLWVCRTAAHGSGGAPGRSSRAKVAMVPPGRNSAHGTGRSGVRGPAGHQEELRVVQVGAVAGVRPRRDRPQVLRLQAGLRGQQAQLAGGEARGPQVGGGHLAVRVAQLGALVVHPGVGVELVGLL